MLPFKSFLREEANKDHVDDFVSYACKYLGICAEDAPEINLIDDKEEAQTNKSFGGYYPAEKKINVNVAGRHKADVLRTLAHELVHHKQNLDGKLNNVAKAGETGSDCENEANSLAGVLLRNYGRINGNIYESTEHKGDESLHAFDVDGTLMHTTARVHVRRNSDNERTESLSHDEYNNHVKEKKLPKDHHYDYSEFRSSAQFHKEKPIRPMLAKLKAIHNNFQKKGKGRVIINTARSDFDDKEHFAKAWKKFGVDISHVHVERAGNITDKNKTVGEKKAMVMRKHLNSGRYKEAHLYDDDKHNLDHFLKLRHEYPHIKFHAHHVQHNGTSRRYENAEV